MVTLAFCTTNQKTTALKPLLEITKLGDLSQHFNEVNREEQYGRPFPKISSF